VLTAHEAGRPLDGPGLARVLADGLGRLDVDGRRVLLVVPDDTRSLPMPAVFGELVRSLAPRAASLAALVALGTHHPMAASALERHLGAPVDGEGRCAGVRVAQHRWRDGGALAAIGSIGRAEVRALSEGMLEAEIPVEVNREVLEADFALLVGPVFPHELIGFSGGHKYLFPGISGPAMIDQTHWLGALMTNLRLNGHRDTPPRRLIEAAASLVPVERAGLCLAMRGGRTHGVFLGTVRQAWEAAVELSSRLNIVRTPRTYHTVVACVPERYGDLWTGSKSMTSLEAVVEDGGTLVLLAPHIAQPAAAHGGWHERLGYHVRDWILADLDRFAEVPRVVLGDLTLLAGAGTFRDGVERRRIRVKIASGIPEARCRAMSLEWADAADYPLERLEGREAEGILVVRDAGEILYRPAEGSVPPQSSSAGSS
jgi:nickel-dependent lactate racemase